MNLFQCADVNKIDTLHLWFSEILTMVFNFTNCIVTIFSNVEMLHNKILRTIEKMWFTMDIKNDKKQKRLVQWMGGDNAFESCRNL
jgi:hypothetical protein